MFTEIGLKGEGVKWGRVMEFVRTPRALWAMLAIVAVAGFGFFALALPVKVSAEGWVQIPLPAGHFTERALTANTSMTFMAEDLSGYTKFMINYQYENKGLGASELKYHWKPLSGSTPSELFGTFKVEANAKGTVESMPFTIGNNKSIRVWLSHGAGNMGDEMDAINKPHIYIKDLRFYGYKSAEATLPAKPVTPPTAPPAKSEPVPAVVSLPVVVDREGGVGAGVSGVDAGVELKNTSVVELEADVAVEATISEEVSSNINQTDEEEGKNLALGQNDGTTINFELETRNNEAGETIQAIKHLHLLVDTEVRKARSNGEVEKATVVSTTPKNSDEYVTWLRSRTEADASIVEVEVEGSERVKVVYDTKVYFLGFIPVKTQAHSEVGSGGEVKVQLPWYAKLSRKPEVKRIKTTTAEIGQVYLESQGRTAFEVKG